MQKGLRLIKGMGNHEYHGSSAVASNCSISNHEHAGSLFWVLTWRERDSFFMLENFQKDVRKEIAFGGS